MSIDKCLDLADDLGMAAGLEVRVDPLLDHRKPLLLQPCDLRLGERFEFEVGQRRAAPEVECFPHRVAPVSRPPSAARAVGDQLTKQRQIDLLRPDCQCVSRRLRHEHVGAERLSKL